MFNMLASKWVVRDFLTGVFEPFPHGAWHSVLMGGGLSKLLFWENRCLNLLIGVELSGDPRGAAFDPAILAIYGQK